MRKIRIELDKPCKEEGARKGEIVERREAKEVQVDHTNYEHSSVVHTMGVEGDKEEKRESKKQLGTVWRQKQLNLDQFLGHLRGYLRFKRTYARW